MHCMRRAASRAACTAGKSNAIKMPMIAITTNSSTRVKPCRGRGERLRFPVANVFLRPRTRRLWLWTRNRSDFQSFVGVDLHKCTVTLAAVDPTGETIATLKISTKSVDKIEQWLLALPRPCHLAVEACPFVEWFIERFRACVDRIDIADATELANRRGKRRKNDRNDALDIARRLARGECPLGFIADRELMQLRKLGRHWRQLSRLLSRSKHAMQSMLHAAHLDGPKFDGASANVGCSRTVTGSGRYSNGRSPTTSTSCMLTERLRERLRREILLAPRSEAFLDTQLILQTVPGIGDIWGLIIAAEIGPFERFPECRRLGILGRPDGRHEGIRRPHPERQHHQSRLRAACAGRCARPP